MDKPIVSAIVSTYNSEKFIQGKIEDLLNQTISEKLEIIVVNSGSQQNEDKIIRRFVGNSINIKYIKTEFRETIYSAWNRGIKIASGEYVTNANTDDRLKTNALELMVNFMTENPEFALVYANQFISNIPNDSFNNFKIRKKRYPPRFSRLLLLNGYMAGSQSLWRRSIHYLDDIWFDMSYEVAGDYDFICRIAEKYKIRKLNKTIGIYYKSLQRENKENQNSELTHKEAAKVKDLYGRRFISSLIDYELVKLDQKLRILASLPSIYWKLINKFSNIFFPGFFTFNKIFLIWLQSLIKENEKEYLEAKRLLEPYIHKDKSHLVELQLNNLSKYLI